LSHPQPLRNKLHDLDKQKLEAIEAERDMLKRETEDFLKMEKEREKKTFLIISTAIAIGLTVVVFVLWTFDMFNSPDNSQNGKGWTSAVVGVISGVLCSLVAAITAWIFGKRSTSKEVDNAKR
jgi:flagellar basal body-associated protein FliL